MPRGDARQTADVAEPMRILIFGQSNTGGAQLADKSEAWPNLMANGLREISGGTVDIIVRPFFAHAPGSDAYVEREVRRYDPDIVFLMLSTFSFVNRVIEPGIRDRFGDRAGSWYHTLATRFDGATRNHGKFAEKLNRSARSMAHRVLPAEPVSTYEVTVEGTMKALQLLAREEQVQVVACHGAVKVPRARGNQRSDKELIIERFLVEMRAVAEQLHIVFINTHDGKSPDSWFLPDGLHVSAEAHQAMAAAVLGAVRDGRLRVEPGPSGRTL